MYRFLTNFRWIRKSAGKNWRLLDSSFLVDGSKPTWYNWDIVAADPTMMKMINVGYITILKSESY
jgi:hypothetical protein